MFATSCPRSFLSKGTPLKLAEIFVSLIGKTFVTIFLVRIGVVVGMTQTFFGQRERLNSYLLLKIISSRDNFVFGKEGTESHQTCGRIYANVILRENQFNLLTVRFGLYTKGCEIKLM